MSKIKDEKTAKQLFGYSSSFGGVSSEIAKEEKGLSREELIDSVGDESTKTALLDKPQNKRTGRPRNEDSDLWQKMTFVVNKEQLSTLREIGHEERLQIKDILFAVLESFLSDYESGKVSFNDKKLSKSK